jgi:Tfp pilus assembly protein PilF
MATPSLPTDAGAPSDSTQSISAATGADSTDMTAVVPATAPPDSSEAQRLTARVAALVAANDFVRARDLLAASVVPGGGGAERERAAALEAYVELRGDEVARAAAPARAAWRADSTNAVRLNNYGITRLQAGDVAGAERAFRTATARPELPDLVQQNLSAFYRMNSAEGRRCCAHIRNTEGQTDWTRRWPSRREIRAGDG